MGPPKKPGCSQLTMLWKVMYLHTKNLQVFDVVCLKLISLAFLIVFQLRPLLDFCPEELCMCCEIFVFSYVNFSVLYFSLDRRAEANFWCSAQRFLCLICAFWFKQTRGMKKSKAKDSKVIVAFNLEVTEQLCTWNMFPCINCWK